VLEVKQLNALLSTHMTMSHERALKESKIKCNNDILKPTYQIQSKDTKKSTSSQGTPIYQVCF